jgi:hypothetical protein
VLRFLAEDVGKELTLVLDSILRVVNQRGAVSSALDNIVVPAALRTAGARASR